MCGIFGTFNRKGHSVSTDLLERMAQRLAHRGPDGFGTYHSGQMAFGAGRLAIIDLTAPAGPIFSEDRRIGVVFNGEIYNYKALRNELENLGHHFGTGTDTEVIVHGYESWGSQVIERLRGMFALCIWDEPQQQILLARDRTGEKPLYFTHINDEVVFASEIKAILEHPQFEAKVNQEALVSYLVLGYVPAPTTMFVGVRKLFPGEIIIINNISQQHCLYWRPTMNAIQPVTYAHALQTVREKLIEVVETRLVSDVPVGAFLSGGVDSTAVVGIMSKLQNHPVSTFTVGFDFDDGSKNDQKFNADSRFAAMVAKHFKTEHHSITIRQDQGLAQILPHLIYAMDDPVAQQSILQTPFVAALARTNKIPVLLTGDGGDELFAGYPHFKADQLLGTYLRIPRLLRETLLMPFLEQLPARFVRAHKLAKKSLLTDPVNRYLSWMRMIGLERLPALMLDTQQAQHGYDTVSHALLPLLTTPQQRSFTDALAFTELSSWLAEDSNMRVDKMTMLMSIEARAPMEDHHMIDLAFSLPLNFKLRGGDFKAILKEAVVDVVPRSILERPKWGFAPPISHWLRTIFRPLVETYLSPERVRAVGLFKPEAVAALIDAHINKGQYEVWTLWTLLVFHIWYALYIDKTLVLKHSLTAAELLGQALVQI